MSCDQTHATHVGFLDDELSLCGLFLYCSMSQSVIIATDVVHAISQAIGLLEDESSVAVTARMEGAEPLFAAVSPPSTSYISNYRSTISI